MMRRMREDRSSVRRQRRHYARRTDRMVSRALRRDVERRAWKHAHGRLAVLEVTR